MAEVKSPTREDKLFSYSGLAANSVVSGLGAGGAMLAATGAILPTLAFVVIGAGAGYLVTNEIRKEP